MAKISHIDSVAARTLHVAFEQFLKGFGKDYGVVATCGSGRYNPTSIRFKVELVVASPATATSAAVDAGKAIFDLYAANYGLAKEDYGKQFVAMGKVYTVCGIKTSSYKYPILGKSARGTVYKFKDSTVRNGLVTKSKAPAGAMRQQMWNPNAEADLTDACEETHFEE